VTTIPVDSTLPTALSIHGRTSSLQRIQEASKGKTAQTNQRRLHGTCPSRGDANCRAVNDSPGKQPTIKPLNEIENDLPTNVGSIDRLVHKHLMHPKVAASSNAKPHSNMKEPKRR